MPMHELIICGTPYHPQQTSATPQRAPELISVQCIGIKIFLCPITDNGFGTGRVREESQGLAHDPTICPWVSEDVC